MTYPKAIKFHSFNFIPCLTIRNNWLGLISTPTNRNSPEYLFADNWQNHILAKMEGSPRAVRRRCKGCYDFNVGIYGSKTAKNKTTKVNTYCVQCKGFFCLSCFNGIHHGLVGKMNRCSRSNPVRNQPSQSDSANTSQSQDQVYLNTVPVAVPIPANTLDD